MNSLEALASSAKEGGGTGAIAPDVSAVAAGFAEDQGLRRLSCRALARRRSVWRTSPHRPINRIIIQFFNRAKWPWYTKPLINRASWPPSNERQFDSKRFDRCAD